jgi:hypothetical protein
MPPAAQQHGYRECSRGQSQLELVMDEDVRPARPDEDEAPQLTNDVWRLAWQCWTKDPKARPDINAVCEVGSSVMSGRRGLMKTRLLN